MKIFKKSILNRSNIRVLINFNRELHTTSGLDNHIAPKLSIYDVRKKNGNSAELNKLI